MNARLAVRIKSSFSYKTTQATFFNLQFTESSLKPSLSIENHLQPYGNMKPVSIIFCVGAILIARLLTQANPMEISKRAARDDLPFGMSYGPFEIPIVNW